jgi:hypothetical protein
MAGDRFRASLSNNPSGVIAVLCQRVEAHGDIELRVELLLHLRRYDRVFGAFRNPEFDNFLGCDLDGFACRRVPAHARFPVHSDQTTKAGYNKEAVLLDLFDSRVGQKGQHLPCFGVRDFTSLCHRLHDLSLSHCLLSHGKSIQNPEAFCMPDVFATLPSIFG